MKFRLLSLIFFVALLAVLVQPAQAGSKEWITVTITNDSQHHGTDTMGVAIGATNCIDASLGESELPPAPPAGIFDMRFVENCVPPIQGLSLDYHGAVSGTPDTTTFAMSIGKDTSLPLLLTLSHGWTAIFPYIEIYDNSNSLDVIMATSPERDTLTLGYFVTARGVTTYTDVTAPNLYVVAATLGVPVKSNNLVPTQFNLGQNFPNPFNPTTTIQFSIAKASMTDIAVYNVLGQKVATLVGQQMTPGNYSARWNGTDDHGVQVASGVYFVRMNARTANGATSFNQVRKLVLMK